MGFLAGLGCLRYRHAGRRIWRCLTSFQRICLYYGIAEFVHSWRINGGGHRRYLVYKLLCAKFLKGHPWLLVAMILYGAYVIGILTNPMVVAIFLFSLFEVVFAQAGYQAGEKTPVLIIICTAIDILIASILYPWSAPQLMSLQVLQSSAGITISNARYLILLLVVGAILLALMMGVMKLLKCEIDKMSGSDMTFLEEKYSLGLTPYQKGVLIAMLFFALGSVVIAFFPKSLGAVYAFVAGEFSFIGWMALAVGIMMFIKIDGKRLLEPQVMARVFPWDMLLMIGVAVTVGTILTGADTGVTVWLANVLGPILAQANDLTLCIILAVIGLLMTNVLNNNAVIILLSTAVVTLSVQGFIGDPIVPIIVVICSAELGFLTPAASIYGVLIHTHKYVTPTAAYKYGAIMMAFSLLFLLGIVIPLTKLIFYDDLVEEKMSWDEKEWSEVQRKIISDKIMVIGVDGLDPRLSRNRFCCSTLCDAKKDQR